MARTGIEGYLKRLEQAQKEVLSALEDLEQHELLYATEDWRWNTVRRVMPRLGDHVREHATQFVAEAIGGMPYDASTFTC
ncbi:MAG: hypothetical protein J7M05_12675 [Anaerolineae bacterium]|nr:hypothetical protein [Anaerolineae bacterium]